MEITQYGQVFYPQEANKAHPEGCTCPEVHSGGDCPWCRVYYGGEDAKSQARAKSIDDYYSPAIKSQDSLFSDIETWKAEWIGMPEFIQEKLEPYAEIIVRFANKQSLEEFASMIGQKLTEKTKSIWHPKLVRGFHSGMRYKDES